eukprot:scaffold158210_cov15-Tisochrysis_lutea.AAC.1
MSRNGERDSDKQVGGAGANLPSPRSILPPPLPSLPLSLLLTQLTALSPTQPTKRCPLEGEELAAEQLHVRVEGGVVSPQLLGSA